ncbi:diguanylate cyclase/phosphodiesterase with PAS/PAC sensor(s) [Thiorhodococcus drewsii AZ1]|uniref:cyclic-guanylate-specific phosphodiesterase n=1 Tax=Thiorhodococcus drewsii AZ1 TaxID=765913 RepID=G2E6Z4_9GAMM|nr:EAL domain-containing protein [Thiorhodococcus drewsii]EGV28156.1 diguanylate cyclase/phosphodiesterase with PAS/PAC sensor(s) [Thiorhodococcus drewsii AZ1]
MDVTQREYPGLLSAVLETVEDFIIAIDISGHVICVNAAARRVLQGEEGELLGQAWTKICATLGLNPSVVMDLSDTLPPCHSMGYGWQARLPVPFAETRAIAWRARIMTAADGTPTGTLLVGHDLPSETELSVAEEGSYSTEAQAAGSAEATVPERSLPKCPRRCGCRLERLNGERIKVDNRCHLQALLDNFPFAVWLKDTQHRYLGVNQVFADFVEASHVEALIGKTNDDFFPAGLAARGHMRDQLVMASRAQKRFEDQVVLKGVSCWLETVKSPIIDPYGVVVGIVGFSRDISAYKQTEQALIRQREQLRLVLDHAPIGIWLMHPNGRTEFANRTICEAFGISEAQFLAASHYRELLPAELVEQCRRSDAKALAIHGPSVSHERLPFADGQIHDLTVIKYAKRDARGEPEMVIGISLDITEERLKADALHESEARANSILSAAPVGIVMLKERVFQDVNETLLRMMGYRRGELIGQSVRLLYPSDADYERGGDEIYAKLRTDKRGSTETQMRRKDGHLRDVILSWAPLDADDLSKGITFSVQDITSQKRTERALRESEGKFHTMVDWTLDWEYWLSSDGEVHYMTPSTTELTGYAVADFEQNPALLNAIVHPEDRSEWERHLRTLRPDPAQRHPDQLDFRLVQKSGQVIWVTHRCRPVFGVDGRYQGRRVTVRNITAQKAAEEQIRQLAYFDPLTGLANRRLLLDRLDRALSTSARSHEFGALLMLDLDHFKALNDTQGHAVGDRLLIEVGQRLKRALHMDHTVSRLGGDEYLVLLEGLGRCNTSAASHAEALAEQLRRILNEPYPLLEEEGVHYATASIGVTLFQGKAASVEALLKQADLALYQAKGNGRDTVRFFDPVMQAAVDERMALEKALRQALQGGELSLYYQPQVDRAGHCIGAEALLRWHRPKHGSIAPSAFIPVAEETGLILPIGRWVLEAACAQLKAWAGDPETRDLQLAVNVSARQFYQPDFVAEVQAILANSGANPTRLKLELTESIVLEQTEIVIERMQALRALGVSFSMDDFGTGYSSLSYLKRLPLEQLKIDKSFVQDISTDPNDAAIVQAILAMSHSLGLMVIAEGVETPEQQAFLLAHGCDAFQGYLFGRPVAIENWITTHDTSVKQVIAPAGWHTPKRPRR